MLDTNVDANAGADAKRWTWQIYKNANADAVMIDRPERGRGSGHFLPRPPHRCPYFSNSDYESIAEKLLNIAKKSLNVA